VPCRSPRALSPLAGRVCSVLEVEHVLSRDASTLSGGERKRVALAAALLSRPELLLLDEPTNHLDIGAIQFLERELRDADTAAIIVTHDRSFLSSVCSEVSPCPKPNPNPNPNPALRMLRGEPLPQPEP
jgi:ATP-binding cassette subfamily F protein 3